MVKNNKTRGAALFSFLLAAAILFALIKVPVLAEDTPKTGVHADMSTFEKNYSLTPNQKKFVITKIRRIVSLITSPDMSDLEKYYKLALWENDHVTYDHDFWSHGYRFQYYRHQWDAFGALTDTSVCAGIAILYSNICHAADLPCKFVRTYPQMLDHTINYIPDINGNAYYVDVTEGSFIMSENAEASFGSMIDKKFAYITKPCTDGTFEYGETFGDDNGSIVLVIPSGIKDWFNKPFADWFKEFALHEGTTKKFMNQYVEKGSGVRGVHYASYQNYPKQFSASEKPGLWFLEDFYKNPKDISSKILNKVIDNQLITIDFLQEPYECNNISELEKQLKYYVTVGYFPSVENGKIVPEGKELEEDTDYRISCKSLDLSKGEAVVAITGIGDYTGSSEFTVKIKPAAAEKTAESEKPAAAQKAANPIKIKGRKVSVKYSKLRKKSRIIKRAKAIKVRWAKGNLIYKYITAKKKKKSFRRYFKIDARTGNILVRRGLKRGTYKVKVKVRAAGDTTFEASPWKTVIFKVRVK